MGKKKKSKKNKLLKMSDEEKARYFQHKAEQEEEAKRRREQLVKAWMIKKIKREQVFSRLNLAKINTHWMQFFRKIKVKEMRDEIKYLQEWLDYILILKNRIINNLVVELQEAEAQYSYNFKAHCIHIDRFMDFHDNWISELQDLFDEDKYEMIELFVSNMKAYKEQSEENEEYLKTILFAQAKNAETDIRESYEYFMKRNYEISKNNEEALCIMVNNREAVSASLWKRIAQAVRLYVRRTDTRRHHMAELRKLDAESATEITDNQERIDRLEHLIEFLKNQFNDSSEDLKLLLSKTKFEEKNKNLELIKKRKETKKHNENDIKKITILTTSSNDSLEYLSKICRIVEHCLFLFKSCQKYETPNENLNKWLNKQIGLKYPYFGSPQFQDIKYEVWRDKEDDIPIDDFILDGTKLHPSEDHRQMCFEGTKEKIDTKSIINRIFPVKKNYFKRSSAPSRLLQRSGKIRPKTSVSNSSKISSTSLDIVCVKPDVSTLSKVVIQTKDSVSSSTSEISSPSRITEQEEEDNKQDDINFIIEGDARIGQLEKLNTLWDLKSKIIVDIKELKAERNYLKCENEQLQHILRLVLESAALKKCSGNNFDSVLASNLSSSSSSSISTYDMFKL